MRLFLCIDESSFFHADFAADLIRRTPPGDVWVGAALMTRVPEKADLQLYLRRNWRRLGLGEISSLAIRKAVLMALGLAHLRLGSVRQALESHSVPWFSVEYSVNTPNVLDRIKATQPDVIVNSSSPFFKKEILALPRLGCLNRHAALLPAYGGLWPIFHALRCGESEVGVSAHLMDTTIDTGPVLARRAIAVHKDQSLFEHYHRSFAVSADVVWEGLERMRVGDLEPLRNLTQPSYFNHPSPEQWAEFRARGFRFI